MSGRSHPVCISIPHRYWEKFNSIAMKLGMSVPGLLWDIVKNALKCRSEKIEAQRLCNSFIDILKSMAETNKHLAEINKHLMGVVFEGKQMPPIPKEIWPNSFLSEEIDRKLDS